MSLAIFSPALPLTMVQSGPYSETQATPRISLRSFVTWLCSSQMMIMITIYNDDENKALLCGYRCHFSRWVIGAPKSGRRTSLSLASYGFFHIQPHLYIIHSRYSLSFLSLAKSALVINLKVNSGLEQLTDGCWSPTRPSLFFTTRMDGKVNTHHSN